MKQDSKMFIIMLTKVDELWANKKAAWNIVSHQNLKMREECVVSQTKFSQLGNL